MPPTPDAPDPDDGMRRHMEQLIAGMRLRAADERSSSTAGTPPRLPTHDSVRDRLGDFRIDRRLGAGGMGEVFAATHTKTGQRVALKVLRITSPTLLYRFKREFRALADITHPNVAGLHELFVPPDGPVFFTMELVEGRPFNAYVRRGAREGGLPDVARLEAALFQLVRGVHHLHRARCIHRDLKPSNVLVTAEGRVVILDFGLVFEQLASGAGVTGDGQLLGTPSYMAPEQANAEVSPAVDYYAIGVMLYQCLTGELPFSGPAMKVILLKQDCEAPDPAAGGLEVPEHLRDLCRRLLQRDPELRPTGRELLELLEGWGARSETDTRVSVSDTRLVRRIPFVGRDEEQRALETAFREVEEHGASITVHVHGPSGYGKSALVGRLLTRARKDERALVLGGRCFERVWVPFKGVDTVVDALSVHLRRMSAEQRAEARPRHLGAMIQVFPVLADIWEPSSEASRSTTAAFEPSERLRLGLRALREVFVRLGARWTLVVLVDDLQWTNLDGVNLLTSIMQPPDPPAMLLLLAFRDEQAGNPGLLALADPAAREGRDVREVPVGPLSDAAALELARALTSSSGDEARVQELCRYARGSPSVIRQLLADEEPPSNAAPDVEQLSELAPAAKQVLACVAVASDPVPIRVITEVVPDVEARAWLEDLSLQGLLSIRDSTPGGEEPSLVETTEDWIREAVLAALDEDERRALHRGLALAYERQGADPETLAVHCVEGGEPERAALYTERAADQAVATRAFAHAVALYRRALDLLPGEVAAERHRIRRALARQLINLGHGAEPAAILLELAGTAEPSETGALRREAALQLARSGRIDESMALCTELLQQLGEPLERTWREALWSWLGPRLRPMRRHEARTKTQVSTAQLERLDVLLSVVGGMREVTSAMTLHPRALSLALELGEPRRLLRALGHELWIQASRGRARRARALAIEARELAASVGDPELDLELDMATLDIDWLEHRYQRALERLEQLLVRIDEVPAVGWIRSHVVARHVEARILMGRYGELRHELPGLLAIARDRGNLHEVVSLEAHATAVALRYEDFAKARRHLAAGRSARTTVLPTFAASLLDNAEIDWYLSAGEVDEALGRIERARALLRRSGLARFSMATDAVDRLHARCSIQALLQHPEDPGLAARVKALCRTLRRSADPVQRGQAMLNEAALGSLVGNVDDARRAWRRAHEHFEAEGMRAHLAATRVRLSRVTSDHESRRLAALADAYFTEERIGERERFTEAFAPAAPS